MNQLISHKLELLNFVDIWISELQFYRKYLDYPLSQERTF